MDVKSAFNNIDKTFLGKRMEELGLEADLIRWMMSFMSRRRSRRSSARFGFGCLISLLMPAPCSGCLDLGKSVVTYFQMSRSWKGCRLQAPLA